MITKFATFSFTCALMIAACAIATAQQTADPRFNAHVEDPAYTKNFPRVLFDEAHNNFHTSTSRYKPFADLIFSDGYQLVVNRKLFSKESLQTFKILVIANALGAEETDDEGSAGPAFTEAESDVVRDWVRGGGSLLLIAGPAPFSSAAQVLAGRFGIEMGKESTSNTKGFPQEGEDPAKPAGVIYSRADNLLLDHPLTAGRNDAERVNRVIAFAGNSLKGPDSAAVFLKPATPATSTDPDPASGPETRNVPAFQAQGIAMKFGKGRVVVLGDADMLSAQISGRENTPMGMNSPGTDNKQLVLNIMHWLSGLLKER